MPSKRFLIIFPLTAVVICGAVFYFIRIDQLPPWLSQALPHCRVLKVDTAVVQVRYPGAFFGGSLNGSMFFNRRDPHNPAEAANDGHFLMISSAGYLGTINDITSGREMGPKYNAVTFNGLPAGYNQQTDAKGKQSDSYVIPIGETSIEIDYQLSLLTPIEKALADGIIKNIKIATETEAVRHAHVEHCI